MTIDEARTLDVGSYVTNNRMFTKKPLRLTRVWVNDKGTIALARIASVGGDQWLDLTAFDLPPKGMAWDRLMDEWVTRAEMKRRKAERRACT